MATAYHVSARAACIYLTRDPPSAFAAPSRCPFCWPGYSLDHDVLGSSGRLVGPRIATDDGSRKGSSSGAAQRHRAAPPPAGGTVGSAGGGSRKGAPSRTRG